MGAERIPLPWQGSQWAGLVALANSGRLPHALLLAGPSGTGKTAFAARLAELVLCAESGAQPCGACRHCRLAAAGSHPDLMNVRPEAPGKAVLIEAVRTLRDFCAARPHQGGWRVALIEPAEALTHSAANALLKTLEEPGTRTLLLMIAHQPGHLPATIRSRCRLLRFPEPDRQTALTWLREQLPERQDLEQLLHHAGGRPLRALALSDARRTEQVARLRELAEAVACGSMAPAAAAPEAAGLEWELASDALAILLRERAGSALAGRGMPQPAVFRCFDELVRAHRERAANTNLSADLVWDRLWLAWRRAAAAGGG